MALITCFHGSWFCIECKWEGRPIPRNLDLSQLTRQLANAGDDLEYLNLTQHNWPAIQAASWSTLKSTGYMEVFLTRHEHLNFANMVRVPAAAPPLQMLIRPQPLEEAIAIHGHITNIVTLSTQPLLLDHELHTRFNRMLSTHFAEAFRLKDDVYRSGGAKPIEAFHSLSIQLLITIYIMTTAGFFKTSSVL